MKAIDELNRRIAIEQDLGPLRGYTGMQPGTQALIELRDGLKELLEAICERRLLSERSGPSTGVFAESDARIDAALSRLGAEW